MPALRDTQPLRIKVNAFALLLFGFLAAGATRAEPPTLMHVHGLAYSADGKQLLVPSHHGLAIYENGKWSKAPGPQHDYMGFSATAKHYYSSGHPAPGSGMTNPFGLIRSSDGGKGWSKLGLEGESDFHLLATGWNTNAVYVWNDRPNSRMKQSGLHFTTNDGLAWKRASATGLEGDPNALAVHPDDIATVAVATSKGVYVSRDAGDTFKPRAAGVQGVSVFFDLDGKNLWYGAYDGQPKLVRLPVGGGLGTQIQLPPLAQDAVAYMAQNPARRSEYAIATYKRNVYLSPDSGKTWKQIADSGRGE
ncbi:MAG TPA: glycosyl hydrolase [Burkholderiaceae bacterium]|nr:glycosyl hydrolase [Burkholderiaceae bacterium]